MQLREYREKRKVPIDRAANELGLTMGYLSMVERGMKWPGPFIIQKIREWSTGKVTANDIFAGLDMTLFAAKPVRTGSRATPKEHRNGRQKGREKVSGKGRPEVTAPRSD